MARYKHLIPYCCYPKCGNPNVECHHLIPLKWGGIDSYHNFISLCFEHHRHLKLHSFGKAKENLQYLYTYKYMAELTLLGLTSDCDDETFISEVIKIKAEAEVDKAG